MSQYKVSLTKLDTEIPGFRHLCLDYPKHQQTATAAELTEQGLLFQGWALSKTAEPISCYLQHGNERTELPLQYKRPDVIQAMFKQPEIGMPQLNCGFKVQLIPQTADFMLGVHINGQDYPLYQGEIQGAFKVLKGKHGWLFLDNDTNKSVEQYTGKLLLSTAELTQWQQYCTNFTALAKQQNIPAVLLIAPAKEAVFGRYYPYKKADITPIDQLKANLPQDFPLLYPVKTLRAAPERSFRVTDTHWTAHGAAIASKLVAQKLGFKTVPLKRLFTADRYKMQRSVGDLGNKAYPPAAHDEAVLRSFNYRKYVVYDNLLPNFGRTIVMQYPKALSKKHCLIFGSSSVYSMLNYLARIFQTVTLVHSAGNIDPKLIAELKPNFLLCQTNGRFVVRPPSANYCLQTSIREKVSQLDTQLLQNQFEIINRQATQTALPIVQTLHYHYLKARK